MARSRILHPGFFTNEDLLELPLEARVLFAGLWTLADREGRLEDRPKRIKIELFPGDNYDVDALLQALLNKGFIHRYAVPGTNLIHVRHFLKFQRCHPREAQSVHPSCPCEGVEDEPRTNLGDALWGRNTTSPPNIVVVVIPRSRYFPGNMSVWYAARKRANEILMMK